MSELRPRWTGGRARCERAGDDHRAWPVWHRLDRGRESAGEALGGPPKGKRTGPTRQTSGSEDNSRAVWPLIWREYFPRRGLREKEGRRTSASSALHVNSTG